jgi:hypothetical protein
MNKDDALLVGSIYDVNAGKTNMNNKDIGYMKTKQLLFPALRSGHRLFQRPSPGKQFPSNNNNIPTEE